VIDRAPSPAAREVSLLSRATNDGAGDVGDWEEQKSLLLPRRLAGNHSSFRSKPGFATQLARRLLSMWVSGFPALVVQ
jgi:hypothetical protein